MRPIILVILIIAILGFSTVTFADSDAVKTISYRGQMNNEIKCDNFGYYGGLLCLLF